MDIVTPRNMHFNAYYKRSFAYYTMKERVPIILTQTIDNLVRNKENIIKENGPGSDEDLKVAIGEISKLKYEIVTDKPLREINSFLPDAKIYNDLISKTAVDQGWPTFFNCNWLLAECYMYRRLHEIFENTQTLKEFDLFRNQKETAYFDSIQSIKIMCKNLSNILINKETSYDVQEMFKNFLKLNLWGNKQDLSITNGVVDHVTDDPVKNLKKLESFIISNSVDEIWATVSDSTTESQVFDIILDNAAYELFFDFCLADFLITEKLASKVRFYVKKIPWFISDAMVHDIHWLILQLKNNPDKYVNLFGNRWEKYFQDEIWSVEEEWFWTYPLDYSYMKCVDNKLYKKLGQAKIAFFKGDLNYRKLFGEKNWDPTTPVEEALQGFHPTKICSLRTVKCDIICGLEKGLAEELHVKNERWAYRGDYGLIQFCCKVD